jgi:hypothetical protein
MLGLAFEKRMDVARNKAKDDYEEECRSFFSHLAADFYVEKMFREYDRMERELLREAGRYPFKNTVKVVVSTVDTYYSKQYSHQMMLENTKCVPGSVFKSPSGLKRRNIYRIFKETEFKTEVWKRLGISERFFLTMTSQILWCDSDTICYNNVIWLNFKMD